jgi:uncharacterized protein
METNAKITDIMEILRRTLPLVAERYQVEFLGAFGSYAHSAQRPESDLDLLVSFRETPSLLKFIELENFLSDLLGIRVDLVMREALKPRIGQRILEEVVAV